MVEFFLEDRMSVIFLRVCRFENCLQGARTFRICVRGTGDSIDLTAGWAETEVVKFLGVDFGEESES